MFLDKELDVICLLQAELKHSEPLLYKSNSFCKKVSRYIKSINSFSDNSGHEALQNEGWESPRFQPWDDRPTIMVFFVSTNIIVM